MQGQVSRRTYSSDEFAGDLNVLERTKANHEEMNHSFLTTAISIIVDEIDIIFFIDEVYGFVSCTNSSVG